MILEEGTLTLRAVLAAAALTAASGTGCGGSQRHRGGRRRWLRHRPGPGALRARYLRGERATVRRGLDAELERRLLVPRLELLALGPATRWGQPSPHWRPSPRSPSPSPTSYTGSRPRPTTPSSRRSGRSTTTAPSAPPTPTSTLPRPGAPRRAIRRWWSAWSTAASPWSTPILTTTSGPTPASRTGAWRPTTSTTTATS